MEHLRRIFGHPRLLPLAALLLRARTVRPSAPFIARELLRRGGVRVYRLRESGLSVAIRHGTGDVVTLGEIFHDLDYAPCPEVEGALDDVCTIVDLGANIGLFGVFAAGRWPGARITAFEPDPANLAIHERTIAANGPGRRWTAIHAAGGARDGEVRFSAGRFALSRMAGPGDRAAITVPIRDVLPMLAEADLLKMDIEGGEWEILGDARFRASPPRALVLEYHPHLCPGDDARATALAALAAANMRVHPIWHRDDGYGMLWAWRAS
ncbi:MAG TPA: FkbM family methyltransferase [Solirubrobacteraceae bacterium]|nr:FkbM family methyltransferase [Solirubrobacteraceae bacterium]